MKRDYFCGATGCKAGPFTVLEVAAHVTACPFNEADLEVNKAVLVGQAEILDDLKKGVVPTVTSFAELHDYVDANVYGGLCDDGTWEKFSALEAATGRNLYNEVQDQVDRWIKKGSLLEVRTTT